MPTAEAQNLLSRTTPEKIIRPPGFYFSIALDALTILSAGLFGFFYRGYLQDGMSLLWASFVLAFFAVLSVLGMLLTKSFWRRSGVIALSVLGMVAFFRGLPFSLLAAAASAAFGFMLWGEALARAELKNALEIKFFRIVRPQLGKLITAVSLLVTLLYLPQWNASGDFISPEIFARFYGFASGAAMRFYPELTLNSSVEAFARSFAEFQLKDNRVFSELPPTAQEQAVKSAAAEVMLGMSKWAGGEVSPQASFASFAYEFTLKKLKDWQGKFGGQIGFAWGVAIFLILRSAGSVLSPILSGIVFFVYQSLLAVNFIKIVGESRTRETLEYS
jgi:hypothetical protein